MGGCGGGSYTIILKPNKCTVYKNISLEIKLFKKIFRGLTVSRIFNFSSSSNRAKKFSVLRPNVDSWLLLPLKWF